MTRNDFGSLALVSGTALHKGYGQGESRIEVLRGVDIAVRAGEMAAIVGPSGCGKSTLLNCLAGLDRVDAGHLNYFGRDLAKLSNRAVAATYQARAGFVFQESHLINSLTALENVLISDRLLRRKPNVAVAQEILETLGIGGHARRLPSVLSVGQRQRVTLARVLYQKPDLIFADEPTGALDSATAAYVMDILRNYPSHGGAVLLVTHDPEAAKRADVIHEMLDGRMVR